MTKDNVPVRVNAVVYFRVQHPDKAIIEVADYWTATLEVAQTTLRSIIGQHTLDDMLSEIEDTAQALQRLIDVATDEWGVKVTRVEIKDIQIPDSLKGAMAKEAEAERERRAMLIRASGEKEASQKLAEAAAILDSTPNGFQMRYLQTLAQVAEMGNTVVFAPTDSMSTAAASASIHRNAPIARAPFASDGELDASRH